MAGGRSWRWMLGEASHGVSKAVILVCTVALLAASAFSSLPVAEAYGVKEFLRDFMNPDVSLIMVRGDVLLTSSLPELKRNVTIVGSGRRRPVIDGRNMFTGIATRHKLALRNLEFIHFLTQRGRGGAAILAFGDTKIERCAFRNNRAGKISTDSDDGGAINFYSNTWTITKCEFTGNRANGYGGALYTLGESSGSVIDSVFKDNYSKVRGGAITFRGSKGRVHRCTFESNKEDGEGGGALSCSRSICRISNSVFRKNLSKGSGGAIRFFADEEGGFGILCKGNKFSGNRARTNSSSNHLSVWVTEGRGQSSWSFCAKAPARSLIDAPAAAIKHGDCRGCPSAKKGRDTSMSGKP